MTPPRIPPVSLDNPGPEVKESFDKFMAARGNVPNLFRSLAVRPDVMKAYDGLINQTLNMGLLPTALKEMAVIRVSLINGCEY